MKRYLHVTTHYAPDLHYGGVVESASKLYRVLKKLGHFRLATGSSNPAAVSREIGESGVCWHSFLFHKFGFSLDAFWLLWQEVKTADVVYTNGIVTFPNTLAQIYALILKKPYAVATHGLTRWSFAHKKWRKAIYFALIAFPLMRRAGFIRVTAKSEEDFLRAKGFSNTILIQNGISVDEFQNLPDRTARERFCFLFLGRTDKEKGLDILLSAYRKFSADVSRDRQCLVICGPDHQGYLNSMGLDLEKDNIQYLAGVYGEGKIRLLREVDVLILPSYSENFGNVVAEALACETPVITTTGTPWTDIEPRGCGLYIEPNAEMLYKAMKTMYSKSCAERSEMGRRGREYVFKYFNWEDKAAELYKCLAKL